MKQIRFDRIGDTDRFVLIVDGKTVDYGLTLDGVMAFIAEKESEEKQNE